MRRILTVLVLTLVALCGCSGGQGEPAARKMEMRVYTVPPGATDMLMQTLNKAFETGDKANLGKVSSPAPGQLVVLAPTDLQASVEASLRAMTKDVPGGGVTGASAADAKPDAPLRLSFWVVDAVPESADDDTSLAALEPALEEARKQLGAVHFELRDAVGGVSSPGKKTERTWINNNAPAGGALSKQLEYMVSRNANGLELSLKLIDQIPIRHNEGGQATIAYSNTGIETTTVIHPAQTLVLTQSPIPDAESTAATPGTLTRLYLVRVDEVSAP